MPKPAAQDELIEESWRVVESLVQTGKATLGDGTEVAPNAKTLVELFKWVASLKVRPKRTVSLPEDFMAGGSDAKQAPVPDSGGPVE